VPSLTDPGGKLGNYVVTLSNGTLTIVPNAPLLVNLGLVAGIFHASISNTVAGQTYTFESSGSLNSPNWVLVQTLPGNGSTITFADTNAISSSKFYRASLH
jgi:hypothetical protein